MNVISDLEPVDCHDEFACLWLVLGKSHVAYPLWGSSQSTGQELLNLHFNRRLVYVQVLAEQS